MQEVKEFEVKRSGWLRGESTDLSRLLRPSDNLRCCLGFYLGACGMPDALMRGTGLPNGIPDVDKFNELPQWLLEFPPGGVVRNSHPCHLIADINDKIGLPDNMREEQLTAAFAAQGITIRFVD